MLHLNRIALSMLRRHCFEGEGLAGGSRVAGAPGGTRENGAHSRGPSSKVYLPQHFPAVLLGSAPCSSCKLLLALVSQGYFG